MKIYYTSELSFSGAAALFNNFKDEHRTFLAKHDLNLFTLNPLWVCLGIYNGYLRAYQTEVGFLVEYLDKKDIDTTLAKQYVLPLENNIELFLKEVKEYRSSGPLANFTIPFCEAHQLNYDHEYETVEYYFRTEVLQSMKRSGHKSVRRRYEQLKQLYLKGLGILKDRYVLHNYPDEVDVKKSKDLFNTWINARENSGWTAEQFNWTKNYEVLMSYPSMLNYFDLDGVYILDKETDKYIGCAIGSVLSNTCWSNIVRLTDFENYPGASNLVLHLLSLRYGVVKCPWSADGGCADDLPSLADFKKSYADKIVEVTRFL